MGQKNKYGGRIKRKKKNHLAKARDIKKKMAPYKHIWSSEKVLKLIGYLEKYKFLWNTKEKEFYDLKLKAETISQMAETLQVEIFEAYRKINEIKRKVCTSVKQCKHPGNLHKTKYFQEECRFLYEWYFENGYEADINHDEILFDLIIEHEAMLSPRTTKKVIEEKEKAWSIILENFKMKTHLPCVNLVYLKFLYKNLLKRTSARMKKFLSNYYSKSLKCIPTEFEKKIVQYMPSMLLTDSDMLKECVESDLKGEDSQEAADISEAAMDEDTFSNMIDLTSCMSDDERCDPAHSSLTFPDKEDDNMLNRNMDYQIYDVDNQSYFKLSEETLDRIETESIVLKSQAQDSQNYATVSLDIPMLEKLALVPLLLPKILSKQTHADVFANSNIYGCEQENSFDRDPSFWKMISSEFDDLGVPVTAATLKHQWDVIIDATRKCQDALYNSIDLTIKNETTFWATLSMFPLLFCTDILEQVDDEFDENSINQNRQSNISDMAYSDIYKDSMDNSSMEFPDGSNKTDLVRHPKPVKLPDRAEVMEMNRRLQTASVSPTIASETALNKFKKSTVTHSRWYPNKKYVQRPSWMTKPKPVPTSNEPVKIFYRHKEMNDKNVQEAYSNFVHVVNTVSVMLSNTPKPESAKPDDVAENPVSTEAEVYVPRKRGRKPRKQKLGTRKPRKKSSDMDYSTLKYISYPEASQDSDSLSRLSEDSQESAGSIPFRGAASPAPLNIEIPENLSERSNTQTTDNAPALDNRVSLSDVSSQSKQTKSADYDYSLTINPLVAPENSISLSNDSSQTEQTNSAENQYSLTINPLVAPDNAISLSNDSSQSEQTNSAENQYSLTINPLVAPDNAISLSNDSSRSEQTNSAENQYSLTINPLVAPDNAISLSNDSSQSEQTRFTENQYSITIDPPLAPDNSISLSNVSSQSDQTNLVQIQPILSLDQAPIIENLGSFDQFKDVLDILSYNNIDPNSITVLNSANGESIPQLSIPDRVNTSCAKLGDFPIQISNPISIEKSGNSTDTILKHLLQVGNHSNASEENISPVINLDDVTDDASTPPIVSSAPQPNLQPFDSSVLVESAKNCNIDLRSYYTMIADSLEDTLIAEGAKNNEIQPNPLNITGILYPVDILSTHTSPPNKKKVVIKKVLNTLNMTPKRNLPTLSFKVPIDSDSKINSAFFGASKNSAKRTYVRKISPVKNIFRADVSKKTELPILIDVTGDNTNSVSPVKTPEKNIVGSNKSGEIKLPIIIDVTGKNTNSVRHNSSTKTIDSNTQNKSIQSLNKNLSPVKTPDKNIEKDKTLKKKESPESEDDDLVLVLDEDDDSDDSSPETPIPKYQNTTKQQSHLSETEKFLNFLKTKFKAHKNLQKGRVAEKRSSPLLEDDLVLVMDDGKAVQKSPARIVRPRTSDLSPGKKKYENKKYLLADKVFTKKPVKTYASKKKNTTNNQISNTKEPTKIVKTKNSSHVDAVKANLDINNLLSNVDSPLMQDDFVLVLQPNEEKALKESSPSTSDHKRTNIDKNKKHKNDVLEDELVLELEDDFEENSLNEKSDRHKNAKSDVVAEEANSSLSEGELVLELEDDFEENTLNVASPLLEVLESEFEFEESALNESSPNTSDSERFNVHKLKNAKTDRLAERTNSSLSEDELVLELEDDSEENSLKESSPNTSNSNTNIHQLNNFDELENFNKGKGLKISTKEVNTLSKEERSLASQIETSREKQTILSRNATDKKSKSSTPETNVDILESTESLKADHHFFLTDSKLKKLKSKGNANNKKRSDKKLKSLTSNNQEQVILKVNNFEIKPSESRTIFDSSDEDDVPLAVKRIQPDQSDEDDVPLAIKKIQLDQSDEDDVPLAVKKIQPDQSDEDDVPLAVKKIQLDQSDEDDVPLAVKKIQPDQSDEDDVPLAVKKLQPKAPSHNDDKDSKKLSQKPLHTVNATSKKRKSLTDVDKSAHNIIKDDESSSQKPDKATSRKRKSLTEVDKLVHDSAKDDNYSSQKPNTSNAPSRKKRSLTEVDKPVCNSVKDDDSPSQKPLNAADATSRKNKSLTELDKSVHGSVEDDDSPTQKPDKVTFKKVKSLTQVYNQVDDSAKDKDCFAPKPLNTTDASSRMKKFLTKVDKPLHDTIKDDDNPSQKPMNAANVKSIMKKSLTAVEKSVHGSVKDDKSPSQKPDKATSRMRKSLTEVDKQVHDSVKDDKSPSQKPLIATNASSKKKKFLTKVDKPLHDTIKDDDNPSQKPLIATNASSKKKKSLIEPVHDSVKDDDSFSQNSVKATSRKRKSSSIEDDRVIGEFIFKDIKMPKTALKSDKNTDRASNIKKKVNFLLSSESSDEDVPLSSMKKQNKKLTKKSNKS